MQQRFPWWIGIPASIGSTLMGIVAPTFLPVGAQAILFVVGAVAVGWSVLAGIWHYRRGGSGVPISAPAALIGEFIDRHIHHKEFFAEIKPVASLTAEFIPGPFRNPKPEVPMWRAVQQVASTIGDTDEQGCFPQALIAILNAAANDGLEIWGKRELPPPSQRGICSDIWTLIPAAYWQTHRINSMATGEMWNQHDHTMGEPLIYGEQDRYWDLRVRGTEIVSRWPGPANRKGDEATKADTDRLARLARRIRDNPSTSEFDYPTLKAILRIAIPHPTGVRIAEKGPAPHHTDVIAELTSIHDKPLKNCCIFVSSIEHEGAEISIGRLVLRGGKSQFDVEPKALHNFCLVSREINDPITPDPFVLRMAGMDYTFRENSTYVARLELRSPYPYPTHVEVQIATGEGLDVECKILSQGLPEIADE